MEPNMEPNSPKKIQFAVPPFQSQLDPQAAEHVSSSHCTIGLWGVGGWRIMCMGDMDI